MSAFKIISALPHAAVETRDHLLPDSPVGEHPRLVAVMCAYVTGQILALGGGVVAVFAFPRTDVVVPVFSDVMNSECGQFSLLRDMGVVEWVGRLGNCGEAEEHT